VGTKTPSNCDRLAWQAPATAALPRWPRHIERNSLGRNLVNPINGHIISNMVHAHVHEDLPQLLDYSGLRGGPGTRCLRGEAERYPSNFQRCTAPRTEITQRPLSTNAAIVKENEAVTTRSASHN